LLALSPAKGDSWSAAFAYLRNGLSRGKIHELPCAEIQGKQVMIYDSPLIAI